MTTRTYHCFPYTTRVRSVRAHVSASLGGVARGSMRARRVEMNMSRCRPTALPDENRHGSVHVRAAECEGLCGRSQAQHRSSPGDTTAKSLQHDEIGRAHV